MWVSKEKWGELIKRIDSLEKKVPGKDYDEQLNFTIYDQVKLKQYQSYGYWDYIIIPHQVVSVKDAINRILAHLKIELTYVEGTPAKVEFKKTDSTSR